MIWCLNHSLLLVGATRKVDWQAGTLPTNRPMIIVSNHQSMFDIPAIGQLLQEHHPKYIAKKSLAKGIPSISYNIRKGGSISIDRQDKKNGDYDHQSILCLFDHPQLRWLYFSRRQSLQKW
ncbi:MAG: hypothetical protein HC912_04220 [Saprospiraceae bacterium]|nr:hypothetical protein [Saprospiraceae bacterium]